ncbi:MAG: patatin-like phospholipase family protein [Bacteroidota bacterium]
MENKPYILGLGLSGGGTRGAAHIGVLRALEEAGIRPEIISGTSAGAIIGGLYAAGCQLNDIYRFVETSSFFKAFRLTWPDQGLTDFSYLTKQLEQWIPHNSFESLRIPLQVGVANLLSGELEMIESGPLLEVIQAASCIPGVFKPVKIGDQLYTDGGVLSNLPVAGIRERCHVLVGVNVMPLLPMKEDRLAGILSIVQRSIHLNLAVNTRPSLERCDLVIEPQELVKYHIFDSKHVREMHDLGYEYTQRMLPELKLRLAGLPWQHFSSEKPQSPPDASD